jgi:hypothetical protein
MRRIQQLGERTVVSTKWIVSGAIALMDLLRFSGEALGKRRTMAA